MMLLYDEEEIMKPYVESERYEASQEARQDEKIEIAKRMLEDRTLPIDKIAQIADLPINVVSRLAEKLQPV